MDKGVEDQLVDKVIGWITEDDSRKEAIQSRVEVYQNLQKGSGEIIELVMYFEVGVPQWFLEYEYLLEDRDYKEIINTLMEW